MEYIFQRKIYQQLRQWKQDNDGRSAVLVEGARRIGKSTVVEEFAKQEYKSYILIDFNKASEFYLSVLAKHLSHNLVPTRICHHLR